MKKITFLFSLLLIFFSTAKAQTPPPTTATVESWYINYTMSSASNGTISDTEAIDVAFQGSDVYFKFPEPLTGGSWIKGTINGNTATFANGQQMGVSNYYGTFYLCGLNESGLCDVVFNYDKEKNVFSLGDMYLLINSSATKNEAWAYFSVATISKEKQESTDPDTDENGRIVVPSDATVKNYLLTGQNVNPNDETQYEELKETVKVAFKGSNVYIQGLCAYDPTAWIKGTISGSTATFAKRQYMTTYGNVKLYMIGYNGSECDITFSYNSSTGALATDIYIICVTSDNNSYQLLKNLTLTVKEGSTPVEPDPTVVTPPAGLTTTEYAFTALKYSTDPMTGEWVQENLNYNVRLGFSGNDVYLQGLCYELPDAWIKGKRDASDGELTFPSGQYYGKVFMGYYFAAANYPTTNPTWKSEALFTYDTQTGNYSTNDLLTLNSSATVMNPYEFYIMAKLTKVADKAATPANPSVKGFVPYGKQQDGNYGRILLDIPTVSTTGEGLLTSKLGYQFFLEKNGTQSAYTFEKSRYKNIPADMTVVPYTYADGWDFYLGGTCVYFYDDFKDVTKIGIQSVYTGGGAENKSEVVWFDVQAFIKDGIETVSGSQPVSESYTDLQGRAVSADTKGLVLKTTRMSDGTVKTIKIMRK